MSAVNWCGVVFICLAAYVAWVFVLPRSVATRSATPPREIPTPGPRPVAVDPRRVKIVLVKGRRPLTAEDHERLRRNWDEARAEGRTVFLSAELFEVVPDDARLDLGDANAPDRSPDDEADL